MSGRVVNLGELVDEYSVRPKDLDINANSLEFYGVSNADGIIKTKNAAEHKAETYKVLEKDCFAYNPYRINVGSIALLEEDVTGLISPAYVVFKPKPKSIIPQLLLMFLKSSEGLRQINIHARGTVRKALRFVDLCKIELPLPDYDEQIEVFKRIKETESTAKKLTTEFTHQLDLVKQIRQAFLKEAMQGELVTQDPNDEPASVLLDRIKARKESLVKEKKIKKQKSLPPITEEEKPFVIPDNWVWCRLGSIVEMSRGRFSIRPRNDPRYFTGPYPFLQIGSLDERGSIITKAPQSLNEKGLSVSKLFPKDTIAIAIVGGTIGNLGVLGKEMCFTDSIIGFYPYPNMYNQNFILNFLRFKQPEIKFASYQMAGQPNIKIPTLSELYFPMPPLTEQQRIIAKLDTLMQYCNDLETRIKENQNQNELLLQLVLRESLGLRLAKEEPQKEAPKTEQIPSKFDPNTTLMEIVDLLKKHGMLHAEELWKMSKHPDDIDAFYAELKKQIELTKTVKESKEKGYLELV